MWPQLTNIDSKIVTRIKETDSIETSKLNCFVRLISGTGNGLIMSSNPNWKLFSAAGMSESSFYGDKDGSGTIGVDWSGKPVYARAQSGESTIDVALKPSPIVTAINVKEGKDQISRHCDIKLTAFTLAQVEKLQSYLMEPGHSLLVEYGWNTDSGVSGLISLDPKTIVSDAGKYNLDQDSLHAKRVASLGEYDSFFGFIVGGTVSSNGDQFDLNIKLRGAPGLPTYLQSHNSIEEIDAKGKVSNKYAMPPFGITDLNLEAADQMAERRFKKMYNELPKTRQTIFVVNLLAEKKDVITNLDFVNFDPVIENQISIFRDGRTTSGVEIKDPPTQPKVETATGQQVKNGDAEKVSKIEKIAKKIVETQMEKGLVLDSDWEDFIEDKKNGITQADIDEALKTRIDTETYTEISKNVAANEVKKTRYVLKPTPPPPQPPPPPPTPKKEGEVGSTGGFTAGIESNGATEIMLAGGLPLPKEKLFSKNRYIRFAKAVQLLNANSAIKSIEMGGRSVNVIIDIKNTPIGAFKGIYSAKPESLLIPGLIPDFSKFFMEQNLTDLNENDAFIDLPIGTIRFAQSDELKDGRFSEKPYYWGYLENLYINFDLFKKELEAPNKTMREVLESMLNEMSAAVNSFWNFQVVEKKAKVEGKQSIVYTVVDENWVGANTSDPILFVHSGEQSKFLQADLDISVPGAMTNQIISKRLSLASNPDQPNLELGGVFSASRDKFMTGIAKPQGGGKPKAAAATGKATDGGTAETALAKKLNTYDEKTLTEDQKKAKVALIDEEKANGAARDKLLKQDKPTLDSNIAAQRKIIEDNDPIGFNSDEQNKKIDAANKQIEKLNADYNAKLKSIDDKAKELETKAEEFSKGAKEQIVSNISANLDRIDVVPNPEQNSITQDDLANFMNNIDIFKQKFRVFCCKDSKFLNILKENAMGVTSGGGGRLSHPLPIKYSFTIMGKSGIRRGDTFNILGIPEKYRKHGLFQVTQIEHTIQDMKWVTRVQGEYRQKQ
jgi:hypothetical protein